MDYDFLHLNRILCYGFVFLCRRMYVVCVVILTHGMQCKPHDYSTIHGKRNATHVVWPMVLTFVLVRLAKKWCTLTLARW